MSEIALVNIDGSTPEAVEDVVSDEAPQAEDVEVTAPPKKARGRPPGAPNKPKQAPEPAQAPEPEQVPEPVLAPALPEPAPKRKKRVTLAPPPQPMRRPTAPLDSPKTIYNKLMLERNRARSDRYAAKIQGYSSLLDQMLSY